MNASKFTIAIAATLITLLLLAGVRAGFSGSTLITHIAAPAKHAV
jgi:hypothetical protein